MKWKCHGNWKTCGFCKAGFDGPFNSVRSVCQKAGFLQMLLGDDECPYSPDPDMFAGKPRKSQFIFTKDELKRWLADGNVAKSVEKMDVDTYFVTEGAQ